MKPRIFDSKFSTTTSTKGLVLMRAQIRTRDTEAVKFVKELCTLWNDIDDAEWQQILTILELAGARVAGRALGEMFADPTKVVHAYAGKVKGTKCGLATGTPANTWEQVTCRDCLRLAMDEGSRGARDRWEELGL